MIEENKILREKVVELENQIKALLASTTTKNSAHFRSEMVEQLGQPLAEIIQCKKCHHQLVRNEDGYEIMGNVHTLNGSGIIGRPEIIRAFYTNQVITGQLIPRNHYCKGCIKDLLEL